mmetsp:Transcript_31366/g.30720  ORF Transcript_31366/g.30720 Transcript_31366/m.30720 type:complete len:90 (+) Transcript_31366:714-983(+)
MEDGKPKWDRVVCGDVTGIECYDLLPSIYIVKWNMSVCLFTKNYVYKKQLSKGQKPTFVNNMAVWLFSGLWHGFYLVNLELFLSIGMLI